MPLIEKDNPFYYLVKMLEMVKMMGPQKNYYSLIIQHVLIFVTSFLVVGFTLLLHCYRVIKDDIKEIDLSEDLFVFGAGAVLGFTNLLFITVQTEWMKLIRRLTDFKKYGEPDTFSFTKKLWNYLQIFGWCMLLLYSVIYYFSVRLQFPKCYEVQEKLKLEQLICGMYYPTWIPFPIPKYMISILFFIQLFLFFVGVSINVMIVGIIVLSVAILKCHGDYLNKLFKKIILDGNRSRRRSNMKLWIQYHKYIMRLTNDLNMLVRRTLSFAIYVAAMVIGFCLYNSEKSASARAIFVLCGWILIIFLLCLIGQVVINMGESITDNICNSRWYTLETATVKDLSFILMMSQQLNYLSVFPKGVINLELFIKLLQASYSYLTLMRNLGQKL